jgi:hypothetical protein
MADVSNDNDELHPHPPGGESATKRQRRQQAELLAEEANVPDNLTNQELRQVVTILRGQLHEMLHEMLSEEE